MFSKREKDYIGALRSVLGTEEGKRLFKYLQEKYLDTSCKGRDTHETYYRLGQRELVQGLLQDAKFNEEDLEHILTVREL